jgi:hypothetical protein
MAAIKEKNMLAEMLAWYAFSVARYRAGSALTIVPFWVKKGTK